jgi:basic amino acid/polyamine antiporter, APA family
VTKPKAREEAAEKVERRLRLPALWAIGTGAMFSSGFFLLPGIAADETGASVALVYLVAGLLALPALLSAAELVSAVPTSGGIYTVLDRSLGPLVGTIAGLGIWLLLVVKSAFALIGLGAYLELVVDVPMEPVAIGVAGFFVAVNIIGVKESGRAQLGLVLILLAVLGYFIAAGIVEVAAAGFGATAEEEFSPFLSAGFIGFFAATSMVFVSYAGLTQVASVGGEVRNPGRTILQAMLLSLGTATVVYVAGVAVVVAVLPMEELRDDPTPIATAGEAFLPAAAGVWLIVVAALAAFASTANAGILAASRYPLAMARDRLAPPFLEHVSERSSTPVASILVTGVGVVALILLLDLEGMARSGSAFILVIFGLLNAALIVMRRGGGENYRPTVRAPLYPWVQVAGIVISIGLLLETGMVAVLMTAGIIAAGLAWYYGWARRRVNRQGAITTVFEQFRRKGG